MNIHKGMRLVPLLIIILTMIAFFYFGLHRYLSFTSIAEYQSLLESWTQRYYLLVVLGYMLLYIITIALSIPGAVILTLLGGFLFGIFAGVIYVVMSATLGACLLFLAVRTALGKYLAQKAQGWLRRLETGFQKDAWNYLLFLRLVPLFPFWVVNIVPALLSMRLSAFASATFLGIIPGSLVYVTLGQQLGVVLAAGESPDLSIIFKPAIMIPLLALAVLALVPILYKQFKKKKAVY